MRFRGKMRAATLEKMFPKLDLQSKRPERYGDSLEDMTPRVQKELEQIAKFKRAVWRPGRSARLATRAPSIERMYWTVRQMHGHRTRKQKEKPVAGLIQLITPANVYPFVDFLEHDRGLLRDGVGRVMAPILAMVRQHPIFKGRKYDWISTRIQKVPKERHYKLLMRKEEKAHPYELLGQIPKALRRESQTPGLGEFDVACCRHDEALISVLHELVLRQKNIRSSRTGDSAKPNLVWEKLTPEMQLDLFIPDCVSVAYDKDHQRDFLMFRFDESETKAGRSELVVMSLALASLIMDYKDNYRGALIPKELDHGQLFANRRGGELSQCTFHSLVCRLTKKYVGRKVSPHIWRDIFAAHIKMLAALGMGGGREQIRRRFFHVDDETTDGYSQLDYAAPGIAALDREYLAAA
jgi:integrase